MKQLNTCRNMNQLHIACKIEDLEEVFPLSRQECINPSFGESPLHIACEYGHLKIVQLLQQSQKHDLNSQNSVGNTPLHLACKRKSIDIIRLLLERRCSTNIPNKKGETAQDIPLNDDGDGLLHIACQWGDVGIVRYLINDERCKPNVQSSSSKNTPLHIATKYGQDDTVVQLLSYKECDWNVHNKDGDTPLHIAVRENKTVLRLLNDQQCNPDAQNKMGDTPLHIAVIDNIKPAISQLLTSGQCNLNVQNKEGDTPLHVAVRCGQEDTVIQLMLCKECHLNIQNTKGDTPLHVAVTQSKENAILHFDGVTYKLTPVVFQLLSDKQCNPNVRNNEGDTPLHLAVRHRTPVAMFHLLSNSQCNPNVHNKKGDTPLHIAVRYRQVDTIVKLLLCCNLNIQNKKGDTPLHIAVRNDQEDTVIQLMSCKECDLNIQNRNGDTALHIAVHVRLSYNDRIVELLCKKCDLNIQNRDRNTPLHIAVTQIKTAAISQLLAHHCNTNVQNIEGDTPLHIACTKKLLDIIKLLLKKRCSINIPNKKGVTAQNIPLNKYGDCLLHTACQWGDVDIVRYIIADERGHLNIPNIHLNTPLHVSCYIKSFDIIRLLLEIRCSTNISNKKGEIAQNIPLNKDGDCLLHIACQWSDMDIMRYLINDQKCNPNIQNLNGNTPLYIAVENDIIPAIFQLLKNKHCNPNILNNNHLTPLLTAIKCNNHKVATALLQHKKCDPRLCDSHGNTALHLACIAGEMQPEMVEVAKQLLPYVDPSCVNSAGKTPIELTTDYQLIQAISHIVECKTKQSVQTFINMFIVGNPETGKSTLVKAICQEATSILWKIVPKQVRRVKNVVPHTAGIVPTTFQSKTFGNTVLHDLAGQVEYYTSHAAVIRSTVISTPPAFIVVVNLSESEEKIGQTLRYWWSFINNHATQSSAPPRVILAGSHADVVKSTGKNVQKKITALLKKLPASFHFGGQVALDCRDPASEELKLFCSLVNQSCTALRQTADVDLHCHVLYAFLLEKFKDKVACTVSNVATSVKETGALLPQNPDSLIPLISTLSDKSLLLLVKGGEHCGDWWIILQKQALLRVINGTIFAPKGFSQHKDLSQSTGVVPFFKLKEEFPNYNSNMVIEFLIHLEFCFKIKDHETLALLENEATSVEETSQNALEEYYFFPALVSVENPLHVWEEKDKMCCKCGWLYKCIRPDQFLTTQFLHVLILRLAFTFALKFDSGDCHEDSLVLRRRCSVWKHGIAWLNRVPIETVVEVGLQHQSVIVIMCCPKGEEAECVQLRSEVIQKVLEVKDEHCKAVKMCESFIHPGIVKYPFIDNTGDGKLYKYSLEEIARKTASAKKAANVLDRSGLNPIPVQDLLLFDTDTTHTSSELLKDFFSEKHSMDEKVRSHVLETLNKDTSTPKFADSERESIMTQFDPVTLHILLTEETTKRAVQVFARQVVVILHTCNVNEYWAALELLEPPTAEDGNKIRDRSIIYPQVGSVIGWFAGYRTAVVRTGQGNKCRDELNIALTKSFPNGKVVIAAGIAYASNRECKFADVLISDQIENFVQYKIVDGIITNRGPREQVDSNIQRVFENPARDWTDMKSFTCTDDNQTSVAHIGCIVSAPTLVQDEVLRNQLMKHTPNAIGGEMEGWVLLELKRTLKDHHHKDIEVIVVKGVADYGDHTKRDKWQWTAAKAAMDCIQCCLEKSGGNEFGATHQPEAFQDKESEASCTEPTLTELLKFKCTDGKVINIPVEIGIKYVQFGAFLLEDRNGSKIKIIAHKHLNDAERINTEIIQEWLTEKGKQPVTWATLAEVLHDIELSALADEIETLKGLDHAMLVNSCTHDAEN